MNGKSTKMTFKSRRSWRLVLPLAGAMLGVWVGSASASPRAGHPACERFYKVCTAHIDKLRSTPAVIDHGKVVKPDPEARDYQRCEKARREAARTGAWPAYKSRPAIPCEK